MVFLAQFARSLDLTLQERLLHAKPSCTRSIENTFQAAESIVLWDGYDDGYGDRDAGLGSIAQWTRDGT